MPPGLRFSGEAVALWSSLCWHAELRYPRVYVRPPGRSWSYLHSVIVLNIPEAESCSEYAEAQDRVAGEVVAAEAAHDIRGRQDSMRLLICCQGKVSQIGEITVQRSD